MSRGLRHGAPPLRRRREHPLGREPEGGSPRFAARIAQLATTNPAASYSQAEMLDLLGLTGNEFAESIFSRCGVERRQFAITPELLRTRLQARVELSEDHLLAMALDAIGDLEYDAGDIGTVITANYYSLGGPTLAHRLVDELGLDPDTDKYHVLGVGCASAVPLFKLASQALLEKPESRALVVGAESITGFLTTVAPDDEKTKIVGSALFGDGCAAALLTRDAAASGPALLAAKVHQIDDTLGSVRFRVSADDSFMHMGRELPTIAREGSGELVDDFLAERGLTRDRVQHWMIHPGGRGIIEGVEEGLGLSREQVQVSYDTLAEHGNMGTPSSFYVLKGVAERNDPKPGELGLMLTIGPGVTVGLMLLRW
jgi:predicted naringenin-chalcone synthase